MNAECGCERTMAWPFAACHDCQDEEYGRCGECEASSCAIQERVNDVLGVADMGEIAALTQVLFSIWNTSLQADKP